MPEDFFSNILSIIPNKYALTIIPIPAFIPVPPMNSRYKSSGMMVISPTTGPPVSPATTIMGVRISMSTRGRTSTLNIIARIPQRAYAIPWINQLLLRLPSNFHLENLVTMRNARTSREAFSISAFRISVRNSSSGLGRLHRLICLLDGWFLH